MWEYCNESTMVCHNGLPGEICESYMGGCRTVYVGFTDPEKTGLSSALDLVASTYNYTGATAEAEKEYPDASVEVDNCTLLRKAGFHEVLGAYDGDILLGVFLKSENSFTKITAKEFRNLVATRTPCTGLAHYQSPEGESWTSEFVISK